MPDILIEYCLFYVFQCVLLCYACISAHFKCTKIFLNEMFGQYITCCNVWQFHLRGEEIQIKEIESFIC